MDASIREDTIHASAVALGDTGILIRGAAGSGKSSLVLALVEDSRRDAMLIADDRVVLTAEGGGVTAAAPAALAGLLEVRGVGLVRYPYRGPARIRLVVDLLPAGECPRLPDPAERLVDVSGVALPRLRLIIGSNDQPLRVRVAAREWIG